MEIAATGGSGTYWVPDACVTAGLYDRLTGLTPESALIAGDIVPFGTRCQVVLNTWRNAVDRWIRYEEVDRLGKGRVWEEKVNPNTRYEDVFRPVAVTAAVAPPAAPSADWNGTCPRCGRGTYTGAFKVEHDGPCA